MSLPPKKAPSPRSLFNRVGGRFLIVAFVFSWICWLPAACALVPSNWNSSLHLVGALGPMSAGLACARYESRQALRALSMRCRLRWRHWPWIVTAALIPISLFLVGAAVTRGSGLSQVETFTGRSTEFPSLPFAAYAFVALFFYGFGEEVGWRGWWLPKLQATFSARHSALLQGLAWVPWHLPLLFITPGYRAMSASMLVGWALSTFVSPALFVWLYKFTDGSVVVAAVFHATMDLAFLASPYPAINQILGGSITALAVAALVLLPGKPDAGDNADKGGGMSRLQS